MKKSITILGLMLMFGIKSFAQTISPGVNTELCPNVEYSFTVSGISGSEFRVDFGLNSPYVISGFTSPTVPFTFKARFRDVNLRQGFKVFYKLPDGTQATNPIPFDFGRIKSLAIFTATTCAISTPVIAGGSVFPRCQAITRNITFPNIQYNTVSPTECFSTVTTYEYLLPSGWKLGTVVSNGTTWLPGGNNVNVTSSLGTGDGSNIAVRPINASCGGSNMMVAGGYTRFIPISRPKPVLAVAAINTSSFCVGSQKTFQITGVPTGAQIAWNTPNPLIASVVGSSTSSTITLQANGIFGVFTLNATVTDCANSFTSPGIVIKTGVPLITGAKATGYSDTGTGREGWVILSCDPVPNAINYKWYNEIGLLFATTTINRVNSPGRRCNTV